MKSKQTKWVSDITYVEAGYGFIYLSMITDAWSRKIMGGGSVARPLIGMCAQSFEESSERTCLLAVLLSTHITEESWKIFLGSQKLGVILGVENSSEVNATTYNYEYKT